MNALDPEIAEDYARWFRCLADATRLRVLHAVASQSGPVTVGNIVAVVGRSQSTVSTHLRILAAEGFVVMEPDGVRTLVRINRECMTALPEAASLIMAADTAAGSNDA